MIQAIQGLWAEILAKEEEGGGGEMAVPKGENTLAQCLNKIEASEQESKEGCWQACRETLLNCLFMMEMVLILVVHVVGIYVISTT